MTYTPPCRDPKNDPNDWFISKDGKQYPNDEFVTEADAIQIAKTVMPLEGETPENHEARVKASIWLAKIMRKKAALAARRHAKDACGTCYFRTNCLNTALQEPTPATHGTWGGYYEEELRQIRDERDRRRQRRL